jgi:hypothetical protein
VGRVAAALLAVVLLAGCGGSDIAYAPVESPPETLPIPDGTTPTDTSTAAADDNGNVTTGKTTPTPEPVTSTDTGATTLPEDTTGTDTTTVPETPPATAPAPAAPEDTTTDDATGGAAPPAAPTPENGTGGATADEGLDQFCADNPGACNG